MQNNFFVIVIKCNNIGEQERQGMMFTTTARAKYLNGYENITKLTRVTIRIIEENCLRVITMKAIFN